MVATIIEFRANFFDDWETKQFKFFESSRRKKKLNVKSSASYAENILSDCGFFFGGLYNNNNVCIIIIMSGFLFISREATHYLDVAHCTFKMSARMIEVNRQQKKKSIRDNRKTIEREFCKFPVLNHLFQLLLAPPCV
jgi:hypothetical protein